MTAPRAAPPPGVASGAVSSLGMCLRVSLLLSEGLFLGINFDGAALEGLPKGWWTAPLSAAGRMMPLGAVVLTTVLLFRWARGRERTNDRQAVPFSFDPRTAMAVGWQVGAFAALFLVTMALFGGPAAPGASSSRASLGFVVSLWLATAVGTAALWLNTFVSLMEVPGWVRRHPALVAGTGLVSGVAYLGGT